LQPKHRYVSAFDDETEDIHSEVSSYIVDDNDINSVDVAMAMGRGMFEVSSSPAILMPFGSGSDDGVESEYAGVEGLMDELSVSEQDESESSAAAAAAAGTSGVSGTEPDNAFYFYQGKMAR